MEPRLEVGKTFTSFQEFEEVLKHYQKTVNTRFVVGSSKKFKYDAKDTFKYKMVVYKCKHGKTYNPSQSAGLRQPKQSVKASCQAQIRLVVDCEENPSKLQVTTFKYDHNHSAGPEQRPPEPQNRKRNKITGTEGKCSDSKRKKSESHPDTHRQQVIQVEDETDYLEQELTLEIVESDTQRQVQNETDHLEHELTPECIERGQAESQATRFIAQKNVELSQPSLTVSQDNLFVQWRNMDSMCWIDVVLTMLVNSPTLRPLASLETTHELSSTLLNTLLKANRQAQILLQTLLKKISRAEISGLQTGAGNISAMEEPKSSKVVCKENMNEISKAVEVLHDVREKVWQDLQPRLRCVRGKPDSPVSLLPLLVREKLAIKEMFTMKYRYLFKCEECDHSQDNSHTTILPSIPAVPTDFNIKDPYFVRNCFECQATNQRMLIKFEGLQDFVQMHFVEGLPHNRFEELSFDFSNDHYEVTAVVQYKHNPDHFIAWVRNAPGSAWMECDGLKSEITSYQHVSPNIPPDQVHLVMWERSLTPQHTLVIRDTEDTKLLASQVLRVSQPNTHQSTDSDTLREQVKQLQCERDQLVQALRIQSDTQRQHTTNLQNERDHLEQELRLERDTQRQLATHLQCERDQLTNERDTQGQQICQLVYERDQLAYERDAQRQHITQLHNERDHLEQELRLERDTQILQVTQLTDERDQLADERDQVTLERDQVTRERDQVTRERDQLTSKNDQLTDKSVKLRAETDFLRTVLHRQPHAFGLQQVLQQNVPNTYDTIYDEDTMNKIWTVFVRHIDPRSTLPVFHCYYRDLYKFFGRDNVQMQQDIDAVNSATNTYGPDYGASELAKQLVRYRDWYSCLLKALCDSKVNQDHVVDKMWEALGMREDQTVNKNDDLVKMVKNKAITAITMLQQMTESDLCGVEGVNCLRFIHQTLNYHPHISWELAYHGSAGFAETCMKILRQVLTVVNIQNDNIWPVIDYILYICDSFSREHYMFSVGLGKSGAVQLITNILKQHRDIGNLDRERERQVVKHSTAVLRHIAEGCATNEFRDNQTLEALMSITSSDSETVSVHAMMTLMELVNEEIVKPEELTVIFDHIKSLVNWIKQALQNTENRSYEGFTAKELTECLFTLATSDDIKTQALMSITSSDSESVRVHAMMTLAELVNEEIVKPEELTVTSEAIKSLFNGIKQARQNTENRSNEGFTDWELERCLFTLATSEDIKTQVMSFTNSDSESVRVHAMMTLGKLVYEKTADLEKLTVTSEAIKSLVNGIKQALQDTENRSYEGFKTWELMRCLFHFADSDVIKTQVLMSLTSSDSESVRVHLHAMMTLMELVVRKILKPEELTVTSDHIKSLVNGIKQALQDTENRSYEGFTALELTRCLLRLVTSDDIRKEALMSLTSSDSETVRVHAMMTLGELVNERTADLEKLTVTSDHIRSLVNGIKQALQDTENRSYECITAYKLTECLFRLATSDVIKTQIIEAGGISVFVDMLRVHRDSMPLEQYYTAKCLCIMARNESIRVTIQNFPGLVSALKDLKGSQNCLCREDVNRALRLIEGREEEEDSSASSFSE